MPGDDDDAPAPPVLSSLHATTLALPPSCVEFVPGMSEWLVMGTYFLERADEDQEAEGQKRSGSLLLARLGEGRDVTIMASLATPFAIFDLHFSPHKTTAVTSLSPSPSSHLLGLASSTGSIALYAIDTCSTTAPITHIRTLQLFPTTSLLTYFSWHPTIPLLAAAALADGRVVLCDCSGNADDSNDATSPSPRRIVMLHAHALEAWVTAFAPDGSALYSGGDDAALKGGGLPAPAPASVPSPGAGLSASAYLAALFSSQRDDGEQEQEEDADDDAEEHDDEERQFNAPWHWQDARTHGAGVTFILPLPPPSSPPTTTATAPPLPPAGLLLTGSYDESLRLLSPPASNGLGPRRSQVLADVELGGGVWRISVVDSSIDVHAVHEEGKTAPATAEWLLLASCMHAGTRVVRLTGTAAPTATRGPGEGNECEWAWEWRFEVLARFEEHRSMNYASAVQPLPDGERSAKTTVVSTSFYDGLVCVWDF